MKRYLLTTLTLTLLLAAVLILSACGGNDPADTTKPAATTAPAVTGTPGLVFAPTNDGMGYTVSDYTGTDTVVIIPPTYEEKPVVGIGEEAFEDCSSLTEITIPASVTTIGDYAFCYCYSLTEITIPADVTRIGEKAFGYCTSLTIYCEATYKPEGWHTQWKLATPVVWDCQNNEVANDGAIYAIINGLRYALKDGVATVAGQLSNITTANIPASVTYKGTTYPVTTIGDDAFENCSSLTKITIPASVTTIGDWAFSGCISLTEITIPASVTTIGNRAFCYCYSLTEITIPANVATIGDWAFYGCSSLTKITIPASVTTIGGSAFEDCSSLTIYCEAASKPSGWKNDWNPDNRPVVWDYKNK